MTMVIHILAGVNYI